MYRSGRSKVFLCWENTVSSLDWGLQKNNINAIILHVQLLFWRLSVSAVCKEHVIVGRLGFRGEHARTAGSSTWGLRTALTLRSASDLCSSGKPRCLETDQLFGFEQQTEFCAVVSRRSFLRAHFIRVLWIQTERLGSFRGASWSLTFFINGLFKLV